MVSEAKLTILLICWVGKACAEMRASANETRILKMDVRSDIHARFATTYITSRIKNLASEAKEISFVAQLPAEAYVSNFSMTINGVIQIGEVKDKSEANKTYEEAIERGYSAGLVNKLPRETNQFETSVNVGAEGEVIFMLTYQEILKRTHGVYKHVINVLSAKNIDQMIISVTIREKGKIRNVHVPVYQPNVAEKTNQELLALPANPKATIRTESGDGFSTAIVNYALNKVEQGQLVVLYDVQRNLDGGSIEVVDGYFVHFFAPEYDKSAPLPANIVFVLDKSSSMHGKKFAQLQQAMLTILAELKEEDRFVILWFSDDVELNSVSSLRPATRENIAEANKQIQSKSAMGSTNIHAALVKALRLLKSDKSTSIDMVLFLTDGEATTGITANDLIIQAVSEENSDGEIAMHCLAFGEYADYKLMKAISSDNRGIARKIYEASDAALQLSGFYSEISTPLFTDINIKYLNASVQSSSLVRSRQDSTFYRGSEVIVLGKLTEPTIILLQGQVSAQGANGAVELKCDSECYACCQRVCPHWCYSWWTCDTTPRPTPSRPQVRAASSLGGFVERMWAYMTIKKLLQDHDSKRRLWKGGSNPSSRDSNEQEALRLSLKYNFVTKLTSMVIVDQAAIDGSSSSQQQITLFADNDPGVFVPHTFYIDSALESCKISFALLVVMTVTYLILH